MSNYKPSILQISNRVPYPLNEGGTIGIYNYTRGYSEAGCKVTLLAQAAEKHAINMEEAEHELGKYCTFKWFPVNTDVNSFDAFLNLFEKESYNVQRFDSYEFKSAIIAELSENSYDIIQIEGTYPALYTDVILEFSGDAKVILRQHNVEYQIWERLAANQTQILKKLYFKLLAKKLKNFESQHLNQYDAIVPVTADDGNLFRELGCTKPIFDSPAGIDTSYWAPNPNLVNPKYLYHIGSLEWMPNVEALMWFLDEVWPLILQLEPELEFFVAGKGMPADIKNLKIEGVHLLGEVDDAASFIKEMNINVVPLKSGSGIRLKILEAMSAGKLVVSTTIGAQGIRYEEGRHLLLADTPSNFANQVVNIYKDSARCKQIQAEARKLIEVEYSNQGVVNKLLEFYGSL